MVARRDFIKLAAVATAASPFILSNSARAAQKKLRIAKWAHFVPEFDVWFASVARAWGEQHHVKVSVDVIPVEAVAAVAAAETRAGKGHDVFIFPWPPAQFYQHAIDHGAVYQLVAAKYGAVQQLAHRSTFNLRTGKYSAFADFWMPTPLQFRHDAWAKVGMGLGPLTSTGLRTGARQLREKFGLPLGFAFTPTLEGNVTLHTLLYSHRAWLLDGNGAVLFNKNVFAVQALKYIESLYRESGSPEQLSWGSAGNVQAMLAGKASATSNAINLVRAAETKDPQLAGGIWLQPPLLGTNGMGVTALPHVTNCSVVWNFGRNQDVATQFLADLVDSSRAGYEKSLGCNFPIYPKTVPDLIVRLSKDPHADPALKYTALKDALHWTPNLGVPGFATPAYMEIFNSFLIPRMVQSVLKGERSPEDAAASAAAEMQTIATKWQQV
jgi:multiple sugar transport system substrate-binding protein